MKSVYKAEADESRLYPMGFTEIPGGIHVSFASPASSCALLLYRKGRRTPKERIPFPQEGRIGDVWSMTVRGSFADLEYTFEADGKESRIPMAEPLRSGSAGLARSTAARCPGPCVRRRMPLTGGTTEVLRSPLRTP